MTQFADAHDWARWLKPVAAAVRNTPSDSDYRGRCAALAFSLRVSSADLTEDRARELCRKSEFWPSVADIEAIFAEAWKERARSASIGGAHLPQLRSPQQPTERTPVEIAAVREKANAFYAEVRARSPAAVREGAKPATLRPADLLASYEAADTPAARFRADYLRKALQA